MTDYPRIDDVQRVEQTLDVEKAAKELAQSRVQGNVPLAEQEVQEVPAVELAKSLEANMVPTDLTEPPVEMELPGRKDFKPRAAAEELNRQRQERLSQAEADREAFNRAAGLDEGTRAPEIDWGTHDEPEISPEVMNQLDELAAAKIEVQNLQAQKEQLEASRAQQAAQKQSAMPQALLQQRAAQLEGMIRSQFTQAFDQNAEAKLARNDPNRYAELYDLKQRAQTQLKAIS
jgi:hypothetical protein